MLKIGDLVRPTMSCGGQLGALRCASALVLGGRQTWTSVEVDAYVYRDVEMQKYDLFCLCGKFEEDEHHLELINEAR